jgi:S1-C subfamily serine protease
MLAPTVQLNGDDTVGSGTLVYSGVNPKTNAVESYVLTSYHVVRNIFADSQTARRDGVAITVYRNTGKAEVRADLLAHDARIDAALLKLRSTEVFTNVANVTPRSRAQTIKVWDPVYAVGCPLGNDPIPTHGDISSVKNELNGANYWMINAPTYFGNSGGGVYLAGTRELVGVFSKIYTHGKGQPVVVPHMGLCTPITAVFEWLDKEDLAFVLEPSAEAVTAAPEIAPAPAK